MVKTSIYPAVDRTPPLCLPLHVCVGSHKLHLFPLRLHFYTLPFSSPIYPKNPAKLINSASFRGGSIHLPDTKSNWSPPDGRRGGWRRRRRRLSQHEPSARASLFEWNVKSHSTRCCCWFCCWLDDARASDPRASIQLLTRFQSFHDI